MTGATVIGICTFRRPELAATLASLRDAAAQTIIVADNDDTPSAAALAAAPHPVPLRYLHAPARNISVARNAILDAARADGARFVAFLDDDEVALPGWLAALQARQAQTGAAAVVGPVVAVYGPQAPAWMRRSAIHDTRPEVDATGAVTNGYTCNTLIDLDAPALQGLRFDPARGRTGGEDTAFFRAVAAAGGRIVAAPDAILHEAVPASRATLRWLLQRRYRMGQTHGSLLGVRDPSRDPSRAAALALATAKAAACLAAAGLRGFDAAGRNRALVRGALHAGVVAELLGLSRLEPYGTSTAGGGR